MTTEYVLVERTSRPGRNGTTFWRLTFYSMKDHSLYEMTVDNTYDNFKKSGWDHVVEDPTPWGVYTGLRRINKTTKQGMPIVTADGQAHLQVRCRDREEALEIVRMDQQQLNPQSMYSGLFE